MANERVSDLKVVVFGASGMVGAAVLNECLLDAGVSAVLVVGRSACGMKHEKLQELLLPDLFDLSKAEDQLKGYNACFFTIGVSTTGVDEAAYTRINHDLPIAVAERLCKLNPDLAFCYLSGAGTDSTEKGRVMWARVKGRTENDLLRLPLRSATMFRLGAMQPLKGFKSKTTAYRLLYNVFGPLIPLLLNALPSVITTPQRLGIAMIRAARGESEKRILESKDINTFGQRAA